MSNKFKSDAVRIATVYTAEDGQDIRLFTLWLSLRVGLRVSVADALLTGLRDSGLWAAYIAARPVEEHLNEAEAHEQRIKEAKGWIERA